MKYIIDTDPGIDDAIAISLGYLNGLDIIGFTLAQGNIELEKSENNIKVLEDVLNSDIKIYKSENHKKINYEVASYAHGKDGMGDSGKKQSNRKTESQSAEDFIISSSKKYQNNLTIICFGPLTNLANTIKKEPQIVNKISKVVIMGISFDTEVKKPYHEFNLSVDPLSARKVLDSSFKNIEIVTHEAGIKAWIEEDYLNAMQNSKDPILKFIGKISKMYMKFSYKHYGIKGLTAPDPITIASVINPKTVTFTPCEIKINSKDKGISTVNLVEKSNIKISTAINLKEFRKLFKKTFKIKRIESDNMNTLKLKYKDTYIENIIPGSTAYEISKTIENDFDFQIIGAKLNNIYIDLNQQITENGTIEFLDRSSKEGNAIYERTLEFLIIAAAKEILEPGADILINYSLDNGIYCEVEGQKITSKTIEKLEEKMLELVKQRLPITKSKVTKTDAIKYFNRNKQTDKVKNLHYNSNSTIDLHKLKNTYDFFFGPLAYDTSQINKFSLTYLKNNTFIVNYPSPNNPKSISKYKEHKNIFEKYQEFQQWSKIIDIKMASDLNDWGAKGEYEDAIRLFETHFESELSHIAEDIHKKKDVKIILISGPSSSGKTTTAKKLALYLKAKGIKTRQISLDDYLVNKADTPKDENGEYDFDDIRATDVKLFNKHLHKLLSGKKVDIPEHDFKSGKNIYDGDYVKLEDGELLIIEGTHALNSKLTEGIERKQKYNIFITPLVWLKIDNYNRVRTTDLRKLRRIVRDSRYRSTSAEETLKMWPNVDKGTFENIYPFQDDADSVISSSLSYEIGVLRIFAEPLLYGIKPDSKVYPEAIRLINLLKQFMPISSESVPKDSILREFIGEGVFNK